MTRSIVTIGSGEQVYFPTALADLEEEMSRLLQFSGTALLAFYLKLDDLHQSKHWQLAVNAEGQVVFPTWKSYLQDLERRYGIAYHTLQRYRSSIRTAREIMGDEDLLAAGQTPNTIADIVRAFYREDGALVRARPEYDLPDGEPEEQFQLLLESGTRPQREPQYIFYVDDNLNWFYCTPDDPTERRTLELTTEIRHELRRKGIRLIDC